MNLNDTKRPPLLARWILGNVINGEDREFRLDDFEEVYREMQTGSGSVSANFWYWRQVLFSLPLLLMNTTYWSFAMLKDYLKIALRNLYRNKGFATINILGLAAASLVFLYVRFEFSYDRFHSKADRIVRPVKNNYNGTPYILGNNLLENTPEIEKAVRIQKVFWNRNCVFDTGTRQFHENRLFMADQAFFEVFDFPLLYGDPEIVLREPGTAVLTRSTARKFFGTDKAVGKRFTYNGKTDLIVSGVCEDVPPNSHFDFAVLVSMATHSQIAYWEDRDNWMNSNYKSYYLLRENVDIKKYENKVGDILSQHYKQEGKNRVTLQKLTDIHLHSHLRGELKANGEIRHVFMFSSIGLIILLLACMNFINLSSAQSLKRSREIGLRKVLGAHRPQLVRQFVDEAVLLTFLALPVAVLLFAYALPRFCYIAQTEYSFTGADAAAGLAAGMLITLLVGILAGLYPAFFASAFQPVKTLKGANQTVTGRFGLRNVLVTIQFMITVILVGCTLIVSGQMNYIHTKNLGLEKERIINIPIDEALFARYYDVKQALLKTPGVLAVTASNFLTSNNQTNFQGAYWEGIEDEDKGRMRWLSVDHDFIKAFDIKLLQGRNFDKQIPTDAGNAYLLNRAAVEMIGWDRPVGKEFYIQMKSQTPGTVIGVIENFNFRSLRYPVEPLALYIMNGKFKNYIPFDFYSVKLAPGNIQDAITRMRKAVTAIIPGHPFPYEFFDEDFGKVYKAERRVMNLFRFFAAVAITLACMGLLGLTAFLVENRVKEIGIRKVFGALFISLERLVKRGYLESSLADPTPERGGRSKRMYRLTHSGLDALIDIRKMQNSAWDGLPDLSHANIRDN